VVPGVDTYTDTHTAAVVTHQDVLLEVRQFATTAAEYTAMLDWAKWVPSTPAW
jgi:hypothetical protein